MRYKISKKFIVIGALAFFVFLGSFLRIYRHGDLLHFQLDQSRDAMVINEAVEKGPGELTLLGPRAAGSKLRLGPAFYYCEYLSAKIFGNSPAGMNIISLIFSILSLPLFYFLFRRYFSYLISASVTALYSVSLFAIVYSRFAWNPNMLLFFVPGFLLCLLFLSKEKQKKTKIIFLYLIAILLSIITQLHFLAFITFPILLLAFLLYKKLLPKFFPASRQKKDSERRSARELFPHYFLAGVLVLILNIPILMNEYLTGGENAKEFFEAVNSRNDKGKKHNQPEKIIRNFLEYSRGYFLLMTGIEEAEVPKVIILGKKESFDIVCDRYCRERLPLTGIGAIFLSGGLFFLINNFLKFLKRKKKSSSKNYSSEKIDFLAMNFLLLSITFFAFLSSAYKFPPRFLLVTYPVAFVFLGLWLEETSSLAGKLVEKTGIRSIRKRKNGIKTSLIILITLILISLNLLFVFRRLHSQLVAHTENPVYFKKDLVLKEDIRFTMIQQNLIIDWILANSDAEPIFVWASAKYYRPLIYGLRYQRDKEESRIMLGYNAPCNQADYFAVIESTSPNSFFENGGETTFDSVKSQNFGTFTVHKLSIKDPSLAKEEECEPLGTEPPDIYARRYTWKEFFDRVVR